MKTPSTRIALFIGLALAAPLVSMAATTISTDISTGGTLSVTGQSLLTGNVGIANSSPTYNLDVTGLGHFAGLVDAPNFVATSTSVASTFGYKVGINTTAPATTLHIVNTIVDSSVYIQHYGDGRIPIFQQGANGTPTAPTATLSGDLLGGILVGGYTGSALSGGRARIAIVAAENWTTSAMGTYISFSTTPKGASVPNGTERMRIDDLGQVGIGVTSPTVTLAVATSTSNATSSVEIGKSGQNKGTCLVMYDVAGTVQYVTVAGGALVVSATSCK